MDHVKNTVTFWWHCALQGFDFESNMNITEDTVLVDNT